MEGSDSDFVAEDMTLVGGSEDARDTSTDDDDRENPDPLEL